MSRRVYRTPVAAAVLGGVVLIGSFAPTSAMEPLSVNGTIWVANRGAHTIRGFDAGTGAVVNTIAMATNSQALRGRGVRHPSGHCHR